MTSTQIRQSFLDFFKAKQHTIVPSSSLMPDSPNLLFTNAGMNQFVPIFLGQTQCPYTPGRAADTQKCIRAGGKHNDLDDVGLDTYHHTFFEMLGNWSFGDYFKREAIDWAWELVCKIWKFPAPRLYATVFCPYLGEPGWEKKWETELEQVIALVMTSPDFIAPNPNASPVDVADQEAAMYWAKKFSAAGCNPKHHIVPGNKKDNFWMMGETGPCGPCTEIHVDLTPEDRTVELEARGAQLVNQGDARCIEIWNNVFIQFNANPDGTFTPLPARHVDTGMGFERVTSIIQGTKGLTDFANAKISNYETDIFRPLFHALERLSGKQYSSTLPTRRAREDGREVFRGANETENIDIAFRVIADHIRTVSFAIADGIQPGNKDRQAVLRRILRRAALFGCSLGFKEPFIYQLVDVLAETMGDIFPEIRARKQHVQDVIRGEEKMFGNTLLTGLAVFEEIVSCLQYLEGRMAPVQQALARQKSGDKEAIRLITEDFMTQGPAPIIRLEQAGGDQWQLSIGRNIDQLAKLNELPLAETEALLQEFEKFRARISGGSAFLLHDTYGFPIEETERLARERGLTVDKDGFKELMEEQRNRARAAQKKEVISVSQVETIAPTKFLGYELYETPAKVLEVVSLKGKTAVILDESACYAEMGGQVGDTGEIIPVLDVAQPSPDKGADSSTRLKITNTHRSGSTWLHFVDGANAPSVGDEIFLRVDKPRRHAIQRHHTVTHLLHWALHEVANPEASQKGSFVGPDKLTFDFNSAPLSPAQVADIEKLVNERILENAGISWTEVPHADVKNRRDVMQFFGDKYGDTVRVVQIGGTAGKLDGYSMELCGGTHTRATGEIGLFRIVGESAIAAGVRRIEAVAGLTAYNAMKQDRYLIQTVADKLNTPIHELEKKIESLLAQQKALEKEVQVALQRNASNAASELLSSAQQVNGIPLITHNLGDATGDFLQAIADALKGRFQGVVVLGGGSETAVTLIATVSPEFTAKIQAGKIIQTIAPIVGGKGGGKPDNARGGGKDASKLDEALAKAKTLLG